MDERTAGTWKILEKELESIQQKQRRSLRHGKIMTG